MQRHDGSNAANGRRCANGVTNHRFRGTDGKFFCMIAKQFLDGFGFDDITKRCGSCMRVDVVNLFGLDSRILKGGLHSGYLSIDVRRHQVGCVTGTTVAFQIGINLGAPLLRGFFLLQNQHCCTLTHYETVTPDGKFFSVIRVEADKTQRLWKFPLTGGAPTLVLTNIKPVGYHVWLDANTLALFVLGQPNTLQLVDVKTEKAEVLAQNIGRALHRVPGQANQFSFVHKAEKDSWWVKAYDLKTRQTTNLVKTLPGSEDCAWLPDGTLLMAQGNKLFKWQRGKDADWQLVADLAAAGVTSITRLAVNAKGDRLALVAAPAAK